LLQKLKLKIQINPINLYFYSMITRLLTHLKGNSRCYGLLLSFFILGTIGALAFVDAYTDAGLPAPTVTSDKDDYAPGEIAQITGSGWTLDQQVHVELKETPDYPDYHTYDLTVNSDGMWKIDYPIEWRHLGVAFTVKVVGTQTGSEAVTYFTDANVGFTATGLPNGTNVTVRYRVNTTTGPQSTLSFAAGSNSTNIGVDRGQTIYYTFDPVVINGVTYTAPGGQLTINNNGNNPIQAVYTASCTIPVVTVPSNIVVNSAPGNCSAPVTYTASATGSPTPTTTYTFSGATTGSGNGTGSGSSFNPGVTTVAVTSTNSCGTDTETFTVTVKDVTAPVVPTLATVTGECSATVTIPTTTDNCAGTITGTTTDPLTYTEQGTHTVTFTFNDGNGNTSTATQTVIVDDVTAPVIAGTPENIIVAAGADCKATVNYTAPTATDNCGTATLTSTHNYGASFALGITTVTYTATDAAGNKTTSSFTVTVENATPVLSPVTGPAAPVQVGTPVTLSANYTDNNLASGTFTFSTDGVNYSNPQPATIADGKVSGTVKLPTGVYNVKLVVTDACGVTAEIIYGGFVVIYDPNGGFVTGGGWIYSNPGSMPSNTLAEGKATFGFNAKYKNGKNDVSEVDGNTNFQFNDGDFHFKSSSHTAMSLVVAGRKATYRGEGTVNGMGRYEFMVSVIDGDLNGGDGIDKFRIKIWGAGSQDKVVYDNELGVVENADAVTKLGSGSIVIHKATTNGKSERVADAADMFTATTKPTFTAYPNPIREAATIEFAFAQDEEYSLDIYDVQGVLVKHLPSGKAKANTPVQVKWDAANTAAGVYIVRLVTNSGVQNLRVVRE